MTKKIDVFDCINYTLLTLITLAMLYPFVNVASVSFSSYDAFINHPLMIWPHDINFASYKEILSRPVLWSSYLNTITITIIGVFGSLVLYVLMAYPLSKKFLKGRSFILVAVVFTMLFNGGIIPNYYLMRSLGLLDTLAALILPSLFTGFNLILMKSFIESLPDELEEAASIDGASYPYILLRIIVPLSKPILATLALFGAVGYWNNFFNAILYIQSEAKWPLMLYLREVIEAASTMALNANAAELGANAVTSETLQYATLMIVMVPILLVYPFLQKYFVKGMLLGSVKG
ncbi:carbohydrate ABC transporter permease [Paenibacillus qinlingensis]|uniref:Aldouronate transport system permease protein n=1 Tax=Paenibacillus qinlingensis TaxID=1837343 RepID=A0ABU1NTJ0_9BACL|nr:carbohydrate ABC transporter permease [Paenibacillus qinlingensis]MDR6550803.1 putative aldouronate transport system permease protein [Paenibacillus qinlingensis]